jgi:hypothetical protein
MLNQVYVEQKAQIVYGMTSSSQWTGVVETSTFCVSCHSSSSDCECQCRNALSLNVTCTQLTVQKPCPQMNVLPAVLTSTKMIC